VEITWGNEKMLVVDVVVSNPSPLTRIESISPSVSRRFRKAQDTNFNRRKKNLVKKKNSIHTHTYIYIYI
jgi:hypothetical protein